MKKKHLTYIRLLANALPKCYIIKKHSVRGVNYEELTSDQKAQIGGPTVKPITLSGQIIEEVNHYNRLKKLAARHGDIQDYIKWVDATNKKTIAEFSKMKNAPKVERVNKTLMEIAQSHASTFWGKLVMFLISFISIFSNDRKNN